MKKKTTREEDERVSEVLPYWSRELIKMWKSVERKRDPVPSISNLLTIPQKETEIAVFSGQTVLYLEFKPYLTKDNVQS